MENKTLRGGIGLVEGVTFEKPNRPKLSLNLTVTFYTFSVTVKAHLSLNALNKPVV